MCFSSLTTSYPCLYPGCEISALSELALNIHIKTHFVDSINVYAERRGGSAVLPSSDTLYRPQVQSLVPECSDEARTISPDNMASTTKATRPTWLKPFVCRFPKCDKSFSREPDLARHALKHQKGPRPYSCIESLCKYRGEKGFYRRDKLVSHRRNQHGLE